MNINSDLILEHKMEPVRELEDGPAKQIATQKAMADSVTLCLKLVDLELFKPGADDWLWHAQKAVDKMSIWEKERILWAGKVMVCTFDEIPIILFDELLLQVVANNLKKGENSA